MIYVCIIFVDGAAVRFPNRLVAVLLSSVLLLGAPMVSIADNGTTDGLQTAGSESPVPGDPGNAGTAVGSNGTGSVGDGASEGAETDEPSSVDSDGSNLGNSNGKETEGGPRAIRPTKAKTRKRSPRRFLRLISLLKTTLPMLPMVCTAFRAR